jgi:glycerophosphoryl diester phosphodiesterase
MSAPMTETDKRELGDIPVLVAHRGYAKRYPENTIEAVEAALEVGACYVEFDVQLTADAVPVVIHDASLKRTADVVGMVHEMPWQALREIQVNESKRLDNRFRNVFIPSLEQMAELIRKWPGRRAFVEIKRSSLGHYGLDRVMGPLLDEISSSPGQFIVISFDPHAVSYAKDRGTHDIAWVVDRWTRAAKRTAEQLMPEFLFCNYKKLPRDLSKLWPGPWKWVLYEIDQVEHALSWGRQGIHMIETMAVGELLADSRLKRRSCIEQ